MKPVRLIKIFILTACVFLFFQGCKSSVEKPGTTQLLIDSISNRFVPDHRMGICNIKVKTAADGSLVIAGETTNPHVKTAIISTLDKQGKRLIDSILILPDTLVNKKFSALVTLSVINIRKHPDHRAELVSQAVLGTPLRILKYEDDWLLVQTPDHYIGWTEPSSVEPLTSQAMAEWKKSDRVITVENSGWIYTSTAKTGVAGDFVAGCILVSEGKSGGFTKVRYPDGREGYINSWAVMDFNSWKTNVISSGENLARTASTFTGLPYLWGGSSSKGVDCSGFSQQVYYLNGIIILRDASLQALHGMDVDISKGYEKLQQGDLLFFGTKENSKLHVTHVAIYKGDTEYIHSSGRVMINSLDSTRVNFSEYRENALLKVKRVIGDNNDPGIMRIKSHPWY
ncbi:MAG: C40 family peptidase [Bacteroidales bacterium]|nr:C40 family peptidase [Bacteroidales bacterium]